MKPIHRFLTMILALAALIGGAAPATAASVSASASASAPAAAKGTAKAAAPASQAIDVGIYLNNIPQISLRDKKFQADFYLWFRWKDDALNPMDTFEIVNGHVESKEDVVKKKVDGVNYSSARIVATITRNFSLNRYPLDDQQLKIQIEDGNASGAELRYVADKPSSGVNSKVDVPGWRPDAFDAYTSVTTYPTTFGDPSAASQKASTSPRFTFSIMLKRAGYGNFIKLFSILFLAAFLAFCAFRIKPDNIDARIAFAASAVFMAVITQSALSTNLPESDSFGMADQLYNLAMGFIIATLLMIIQTHRISSSGREAQAEKISRLCGIVFPLVYIAGNIYIVIAA